MKSKNGNSYFIWWYKLLLAIFLLTISCTEKNQENKDRAQNQGRPNIVIFYVDDLGYGDLGCYGATGVKTPFVDRLASNGIRFTDAHSSAATCTPSRYSLLTGQYAFRNKAEILPGDAPLLIRPGTPTIPSMLKESGYRTAVVGKWHLGLGNGDLDWTKEIVPGPLEIGFDYSFLIPATGDRVPTVYVENRRVVNLKDTDSLKINYSEKIGDRPTGLERPELLRIKSDKQHRGTIINGISRIGTMAGGRSAEWVDEDFPFVLTKKAKGFIQRSENRPFFLFFSFHDIHVPRLPHESFKGKSNMGLRGDAIAQMDWMTGEIVEELERLGLDGNTLIIFTSDNGPVLNDGYEDQSVELLGDHRPSGDFRGGKYSAYEAGTRIPTIAYWPAEIGPGESDALWSQVDLFSSISELVGSNSGTTNKMDSKNMLPVILGKSSLGRKLLLEESFTLGLRNGNWKYIEPTDKTPNMLKKKGIEDGAFTRPQLFNLAEDKGEHFNLAEDYPDKVFELQQILDSIKAN